MQRFILGVVLGLCLFSLLSYDYDTFSERRKLVKKQYVKDDLDLKVKIFKTKKDLQKEYEKRFPDTKDKILGFSVWYHPHDGTCTIYVPDPKDTDDIETWGHELMHCVYGQWHK